MRTYCRHRAAHKNITSSHGNLGGWNIHLIMWKRMNTKDNPPPPRTIKSTLKSNCLQRGVIIFITMLRTFSHVIPWLWTLIKSGEKLSGINYFACSSPLRMFRLHFRTTNETLLNCRNMWGAVPLWFYTHLSVLVVLGDTVAEVSEAKKEDIKGKTMVQMFV